MNKKLVLYSVLAAMIGTALPLAAQAEPDRGWHGGHPDAWYFHPRYVGRRYVVAPVPAPVYVAQPYYYVPTAPVYVAPEPGISLSITR